MLAKKRWQFLLIIAVAALTFFNIIPSMLYYSKDLDSPVKSSFANENVKLIKERVKEDSKVIDSWFKSFFKRIGIKEYTLENVEYDKCLFKVSFKKNRDFNTVSNILNYALKFNQFLPGHLKIVNSNVIDNSIVIYKSNDVSLIDLKVINKIDNKGFKKNSIAGVFRTILLSNNNIDLEQLLIFSKQVVDINEFNKELLKDKVKNLPNKVLSNIINSMNYLLNVNSNDNLNIIEDALNILKAFSSNGKHPNTYRDIYSIIDDSYEDDEYNVNLNEYSLVFDRIISEHDSLKLIFDKNLPIDKFENLFKAITANLVRNMNMPISYCGDYINVSLDNIDFKNTLLELNLNNIANNEVKNIIGDIKNNFRPKSKALSDVEVVCFEDYNKLPIDKKSNAIIVYAPILNIESDLKFNLNSIYVILKGINRYLDFANNEDEKGFINDDLKNLSNILSPRATKDYLAKYLNINQSYSNDYIFESSNYYKNLIESTYEYISINKIGNQAFIDLGLLKDRLLKLNKIDDKRHDILLKWSDEYYKINSHSDSEVRFLVPPNENSIFLSNLKLSLKKYFRGDNKKVIKWGLDLAGGKSVKIKMKDTNGNFVNNPVDLNFAKEELFKRINSLGVAEVSIRVDGESILLDFPGAQELSADELIKSSSMYFHIVNEKFSIMNEELYSNVESFLQDIWDDAVLSGDTSTKNIMNIAREKLNSENEDVYKLVENGLKLSPNNYVADDTLDTRYSKIVKVRGFDNRNSRHPLMIIFSNFALEGSSLSNIKSDYNYTRGNVLSFSVGNSYQDERSGSPRDAFYKWTYEFSKDTMLNEDNEKISNGMGWRMAAVLNDEVITAPSLSNALSTGGEISGTFSQRREKSRNGLFAERALTLKGRKM